MAMAGRPSAVRLTGCGHRGAGSPTPVVVIGTAVIGTDQLREVLCVSVYY
jgi:hypothetical protein